ncbi:MAG: alcohol dehydrogenase, partial [Aliifodinibius sp.]|nr:alcohol dehydrogenase [Fodinibius sp.]NIV11792.1 alcohol dehydrogenase [Fodinibius sp.]NIY28330.1 alcohol dehydrogenase [Fodinibius sp.]
YVVVPESNILKKPEYLSFEEAAAIPLAGLTGYRALFRQGNLQPGETVLITGVGGGVASLMLQMALAHGAT